MSAVEGNDWVKVIFDLEQDAEGYPPANSEGLWGHPLEDGLFQLDNIPFFVKGVACEDVVSATTVDGKLRFQEVIRPSGHATLRLIIQDKEDVASVKALLKTQGCAVEQSHVPGLISVDVPPTVPFGALKRLLDEGEEQERWEYEEACLPLL